jgi:hypothetical protein
VAKKSYESFVQEEAYESYALEVHTTRAPKELDKFTNFLDQTLNFHGNKATCVQSRQQCKWGRSAIRPNLKTSFELRVLPKSHLSS